MKKIFDSKHTSSLKFDRIETKKQKQNHEDYTSLMKHTTPLLIKSRVINDSYHSVHIRSINGKLRDKLGKSKHSSTEMYRHKDIICLPCLCDDSSNFCTTCEKNDIDQMKYGAKGHKIILLIKGKMISDKYYIVEIAKKFW